MVVYDAPQDQRRHQLQAGARDDQRHDQQEQRLPRRQQPRHLAVGRGAAARRSRAASPGSGRRRSSAALHGGHGRPARSAAGPGRSGHARPRASRSACDPTSTIFPSSSRTTRSTRRERRQPVRAEHDRRTLGAAPRPDGSQQPLDQPDLGVDVDGRERVVQDQQARAIRAPASSARARAIRWRCPPETRTPPSPIGVSRPAGNAATSARAPPAGPPAPPGRPAPPDAAASPSPSAPNTTFSRTVAGEQPGVLGEVADQRSALLRIERARRSAHANLAAFELVQPDERLRQRALPRADGARSPRRAPPAIERVRSASDGRPAPRIAEGDVTGLHGRRPVPRPRAAARWESVPWPLALSVPPTRTCPAGLLRRPIRRQGDGRPALQPGHVPRLERRTPRFARHRQRRRQQRLQAPTRNAAGLDRVDELRRGNRA